MLLRCAHLRRRSMVCSYAQHRALSPRDAVLERCARASPRPSVRTFTSRDRPSAARPSQAPRYSSGTVIILYGNELRGHAVFASSSCPARTASIRCARPAGSNRAPGPVSRRTSPQSALARLEAHVGAAARPPHGCAHADWRRRCPPACIGRLCASGGATARPWRQRVGASRRRMHTGRLFGRARVASAGSL